MNLAVTEGKSGLHEETNNVMHRSVRNQATGWKGVRRRVSAKSVVLGVVWASVGGCSAGSAASGGSGSVPSATLIEEGAAVFAGAGRCAICHGAEGGGTPMGPNLRDDQWLNGDGSIESLVDVIDVGVPQPAQFPRAMLPRGGSQIDSGQVRAVAAYVLSFRNRT